ncbi:MAG: VOC family protein [Nitrososphaeraceae archaeon]|jgi:predicted enzyme related to lactoylglutathione lyase
MFGKISAIILLVADAPKLISFYRDVLELEVKQDSEDWIELSTKEGSTVLALYPKRDNKKPSNVKQGLEDGRNMLIGFNVSDLDIVCKELEKRGVNFFKRPSEESFGKHAIIEDPEGNLISIAEMKPRDEYTQISYYHGFAPE